jgi:acyl-ACP thioesterase
MQKTWNETFKIKTYHVDFRQELKLSSMLRFFQEAASNHAEHLGAGYNALIEKNLFWALSRLKIEFSRIPSWGEEITIKTWPCGAERLFFRRDFEIRGEDNEVIAKGVSGWLLVSSLNLRPQRMNALGIEIPSNEGVRALNEFPDKITPIESSTLFEKDIQYDEIDMNMHVNNTRYLDWVLNCFNNEHYVSHKISGLSLEFLAETRWGDTVELQKSAEGNSHFIQAVNKTDSTPLFRATTEWTKR